MNKNFYILVFASLTLAIIVACGSSPSTPKRIFNPTEVPPTVPVNDTSNIEQPTEIPNNATAISPSPNTVFRIPSLPFYPKISSSKIDLMFDDTCNGTPYTYYRVYYFVDGIGVNVSRDSIDEFYKSELTALGWQYYHASYHFGELYGEPGYDDFVEQFWSDEHRSAPIDPNGSPLTGSCFNIRVGIGLNGIKIIANLP